MSTCLTLVFFSKKKHFGFLFISYSDYGISDVRFEIPVLSIEEALEKYDEYLKIFSDNMRKKMEEKQNKPEIIVPDQEVSV